MTCGSFFVLPSSVFPSFLSDTGFRGCVAISRSVLPPSSAPLFFPFPPIPSSSSSIAIFVCCKARVIHATSLHLFVHGFPLAADPSLPFVARAGGELPPFLVPFLASPPSSSLHVRSLDPRDGACASWRTFMMRVDVFRMGKNGGVDPGNLPFHRDRLEGVRREEQRTEGKGKERGGRGGLKGREGRRLEGKGRCRRVCSTRNGTRGTQGGDEWTRTAHPPHHTMVVKGDWVEGRDKTHGKVENNHAHNHTWEGRRSVQTRDRIRP